MAENLKNTIQIDGKEYNINAVNSKTAEQLNESLTVKESGTEAFKFNGSIAGEIDYVPTTGGSYSGAVYQNKPTITPEANEFITSAQINNRITNLNGAPICLWNTSLNSDLTQCLYPLRDNSDKLYKFTAITGTESDFYLLQGVLAGGSSELKYELVTALNAEPYWKTVRFGNDNDTSGVAVIPDTHKGTYNNTELEAHVRGIGERTFQNYTNLTGVIISAEVTYIGENAFNGCDNLKTIYYKGTEAQWSNISIAAGNEILNSVSKVYSYSAEIAPVVGTPIDLNEISKGPFIYICKDKETTASNKIFLKLPESNEIVEIAKGATYLSSTYTTDSYTYEGLAEIIARINKRLEAIGGKELKINETDILSVPTIDDVNALVPEIEVKEYFDPTKVPTIQSIRSDLDSLIDEVYELTNEVEYELEGLNSDGFNFTTNSRIDNLEDLVKPLMSSNTNTSIDYPDIIEFEWED